MPDGIGKMTYSHGRSYSGLYKEGRKHLFGRYERSDAQDPEENFFYEGQYEMDKCQGHGTYSGRDFEYTGQFNLGK